MVLNFLGPFKPLAVIIIWILIISSWFFAIAITVLIPFSFVITVPWIIILVPVSIFAFTGLYIMNKRKPDCRMVGGELECTV